MKKGTALAIALLAWPLCVFAQQKPAPAIPPAVPPEPPRADTSKTASTRITLDEAIRLALQHNHALLALRTTILQNQAQETTANLRPNPVLSWDAQFLPIFQPSKTNTTFIDQQSQFDIGISYLFERGKKRQHRLEAAKDATAVTRAQVTDSERQ